MSKITKPAIALTLAFGLALTLSGCKDDDAQTPDTNTTENGQSIMRGTSGRVLEPVNEAFLLTLENLPVTRPNGTIFNVSALAYCDLIDNNYNASNAASLEAYTKACTEITHGALQYYACDRPSFLASVATNNPALRARSLNRPIEEVTDGTLLSEAQLRFIIQDRDYNVFTVTNVSDLEAASPYEGFTRGEDCPSHFRTPRPTR